jgi:hypothetical protein
VNRLASLVQWLERLIVNQEVMGSSPIRCAEVYMDDIIKELLSHLQKIVNTNVIEIKISYIGINELRVTFKENELLASTNIQISLLNIDCKYYATYVAHRLIRVLSIERYYNRAFGSETYRTYA